jgi:hypothetical protein
MTHSDPPSVPATKKKPTKAQKIIVATFTIVVMLCLCGGLIAAVNGNGGSSDKPAAASSPKPTTAATSAAPKALATTAPAAPAKAQPVGITTEGVLLVPAEVKPGTYRTTVPADSFGCYWERLSGTSGELADIIANGNVSPGQRATVTVKKTDKAFKTQGCGSWAKIG